VSHEDNQYAKAKHIILTDRKASTSYLQRRLQVGYNAAAAIMERLEKDGIVSQADHVGKREILAGPPGDVPPWEDDAAEPSEAAPTAAPAAPRPAPSVLPSDGTVYSCSGCDAEADGNAKRLPQGWYEQYSDRLGVMHRCPDCAKKNAVKIATSTMSTEEIAAAGPGADAVTSAAQGRLRTIVERCQRLLEDVAVVRNDLKEVFAEAKGEGFDVKIIRKLLSELQKDPAKREEERELLELYATSIGAKL
jgi:uncharacterized protein (UPF0335 family)